MLRLVSGVRKVRNRLVVGTEREDNSDLVAEVRYEEEGKL
jgi:hypothetical protein